MSKLGERGEGKLSLVLWLAVLIVAGMVAYEAVPVRIRMAEFQDYMVESAERARFHNEEQLKRNILSKAQELDLPLRSEDLKVSLANGQVRIQAHYTIPLEFPFYTYTWRKEHIIDRPVYYW